MSDGVEEPDSLQGSFALSTLQRPNSFNIPQFRVLSLRDPILFHAAAILPSVHVLLLQSLMVAARGCELSMLLITLRER